MRVWGAKDLGGGMLMSASAEGGEYVYALSSGTVYARSAEGSRAVRGGCDGYARVPGGSVTVKGGAPVYESE